MDEGEEAAGKVNPRPLDREEIEKKAYIKRDIER